MKDQILVKISRKRIAELFEQAGKTDNIELSRRYIKLMEKIGMRMNITLEPAIKRSYCKKCKTPYKNIKISLKNKMVIIHCPYCGNIRRIPFENKNQSIVSSSK
ncbi:ribonuclease P [Ferroplasma sp.]|uniref:ribonuclease P protein component 4 n=1 Tax=Ferroplasma sp. TaxID=2591003 RepID=UPI00307F89C8